jgi:hypothetical protein
MPKADQENSCLLLCRLLGKHDWRLRLDWVQIPWTTAEQKSCSWRLLGFIPMHSDFQRFVNIAIWFRQLDLAPFDGLIWPHLKACDLLFRVGLGGRSPKGDWSQGQHGAALLPWSSGVRRPIRAYAPPV